MAFALIVSPEMDCNWVVPSLTKHCLALDFRDNLMFATAFAFNLAFLNTWSLLDTSPFSVLI